jgi:aerobic-type carbon monoxide dehydrogenase small subunit (CoxS/CutS family)
MADKPTGRVHPEPRFDSFVSKATSRRQFIKGVIFSGAAAAGGGYLLTLGGCSGSGGSAAGVERLLTLNVNGQMRPVDVAPNETLAMTLRYKLQLTGTKLGCDRGECGACTVLVDGVANYSCSTLTHSLRGRAITTIEGLEGPNGELHKVQQAMIDELGPQCGFCTPGQIMSAVALLNENPTPTRDEVRHALAGNLCRCGAYDHYLNAVMRAATGERVSQA